MDRKRILLYTLAFVVFAVLVYMQFRTWRHFDWATFWRESGNLGKPPHIYHLFHAVALIYMAYAMRALRWKIFLRPVRPQASSWKLVAPTLVGFTGLALLGRPGELIRPYLIARREDLTFSSQLAVWAVERIFDIAAFTILLVLAAFLATAPKRLTYHRSFQKAGLIFLALSVGLTIGAIVVAGSGRRWPAGWSADLLMLRPIWATVWRCECENFVAGCTPSTTPGRSSCWPWFRWSCGQPSRSPTTR